MRSEPTWLHRYCRRTGGWREELIDILEHRNVASTRFHKHVHPANPPWLSMLQLQKLDNQVRPSESGPLLLCLPHEQHPKHLGEHPVPRKYRVLSRS